MNPFIVALIALGGLLLLCTAVAVLAILLDNIENPYE